MALNRSNVGDLFIHSGIAMQDSASQFEKSHRVQQSLWRGLLASFCSFFLRLFADLQDFILAIRLVRTIVLYALGPGCQSLVLQAVSSPPNNKESFDDLKYFLGPDAKELLLHASYHAFAWRPAALSKYDDMTI